MAQQQQAQRATALAAFGGLLLLLGGAGVPFCSPGRPVVQPRSAVATAAHVSQRALPEEEEGTSRRGLGLGLGVALGLALGLASAPKPSKAAIKGIWSKEDLQSKEPTMLNFKGLNRVKSTKTEVCVDPKAEMGDACKEGDAKYDKAALNQIPRRDEAAAIANKKD
mmetsp:Transcript_61646/g.138901  ORF Transcript_61646/g.138901 Transcript_61646/m.138901 type:complete len:166 (-) Transcript_61646:77-574(-)|eukprot:CAMPEP_0197886578 /NCGR_PEP_ID=MMETSP1439-20131203/16916_1 /TAXON_ID=66791 /ORGANISM="Gonyaulax spinifera, Strain CCMP409" /LENGTH=165 /DNA_ID=CAMNT_0043506383 /DNA_START=75 /DNA_END=572 /DNA_ORIENTATION=-